MVDFASGLMSFTTGLVKGGIEQQRRRDERELGIIQAAEEDAATEVGILIEEARKELQEEQNLFNLTAKNQLNNFNKIAVEYKNTPELLDDLNVLAVSRPDLFQGTDIDVIRDNVKAYFTDGETITPQSPAFKQFETDYGVGATGSSVFTSQMDAYNAKVRANMANLVGANSTKLLLDEYIPAGSQIRDRTLEKYNEGRVGREDFLGTVGQFTGADVTAMPTAKADYAGMAGFRTPADFVNPFENDTEFQIAELMHKQQGDRFSTERSAIDYYTSGDWRKDLDRIEQVNPDLANQLKAAAAGNAMKSVMAGQELSAETLAEAEFAVSAAIKLPSDQKTAALNNIKNQIQDEDVLNEIADNYGAVNFASLYDEAPMPMTSFENMEDAQLPQGLTMPPKKFLEKKGKKTTKINPEYTEWLSNNKDAWNNYLDNIRKMEPQKRIGGTPKQIEQGKAPINPEWNKWNDAYGDILKIGNV